MRYDLLIGEDDLIRYVWKQSTDDVRLVGKEKESVRMLKGVWEGGSVTNLKFVAVDPLTNGTVELTIAWPLGGLSTNAVDFFACTNLLAPYWEVILTTNVDPNTNCFSWVDQSTNYTIRFYDCWTLTDSDEDGLSDGREKRLYETDSEDEDTDGDNLSDGEEVNTYGTDPKDPDEDDDQILDGWEMENFGTLAKDPSIVITNGAPGGIQAAQSAASPPASVWFPVSCRATRPRMTVGACA